MIRAAPLAARYWNATEAEARLFEAGEFLPSKEKSSSFRDNCSSSSAASKIAIQRPSISTTSFPPPTKISTLFLNTLKHNLARLKDPHLQALTQAFLMDEDFMQKFIRVPAGIRNHHAYIGGLLEHVVNILQVLDRIADLYPQLNIDLLRTGIFLHDLGKVRELRYDRDFAYTDEGQLIGHLVIGVEMLDEKLSVAAGFQASRFPRSSSPRSNI